MTIAIETAPQTTLPGTRCVSIVGVPSGSSCKYPITVCRVYEARARQSDGVITWRAVPGTDRHRTSHAVTRGISDAQMQRAHEYANELGVSRLFVRHGQVCL